MAAPRARTLAALLAGLALTLLVVPSGSAAADGPGTPRVVALEWDGLENLVALGITPVGGADLAGYRRYVSVPLPKGIVDVGTRQEPSIERIARLKPDLIVAARYRVGRSLPVLRKIAKVVVTDPFSSGGPGRTQYDAMVRDVLAVGRAVGREARARALVGQLNRRLAELRARLASAGRSGARVTVATPGGTVGSPAARLFTGNSAAAGVLRRLGLESAWPVPTSPYGFSTVGVEALQRVQDGWLALVVPEELAGQVSGFTDDPSYERLAMVEEGRVVRLKGDTWLFGGPRSTMTLASRLVAGLTR